MSSEKWKTPKNENYITYGNIINFVGEGCNPPIINSISPSSAGIVSPITISDKSFSYISTKVIFDNSYINIDSFINTNIQINLH